MNPREPGLFANMMGWYGVYRYHWLRKRFAMAAACTHRMLELLERGR